MKRHAEGVSEIQYLKTVTKSALLRFSFGIKTVKLKEVYLEQDKNVKFLHAYSGDNLAAWIRRDVVSPVS